MISQLEKQSLSMSWRVLFTSKCLLTGAFSRVLYPHLGFYTYLRKIVHSKPHFSSVRMAFFLQQKVITALVSIHISKRVQSMFCFCQQRIFCSYLSYVICIMTMRKTVMYIFIFQIFQLKCNKLIIQNVEFRISWLVFWMGLLMV